MNSLKIVAYEGRLLGRSFLVMCLSKLLSFIISVSDFSIKEYKSTLPALSTLHIKAFSNVFVKGNSRKALIFPNSLQGNFIFI